MYFIKLLLVLGPSNCERRTASFTVAAYVIQLVSVTAVSTFEIFLSVLVVFLLFLSEFAIFVPRLTDSFDT